jgi:hypothetical protein
MDVKFLNDCLLVRSAADDVFVWRLKRTDDGWQLCAQGCHFGGEQEALKYAETYGLSKES